MTLNFRKKPNGVKKKGDQMWKIPMNIQYFAEGGEGDGGKGGGNQTGQQSNQQTGQQPSGVDYEKIQSMLDKATAKKENDVLKTYFQQQGLSEQEVSQAITEFKAAKEQKSQQQQSDNEQLQQKATEAQQLAEKAQIELEATKVAMTLGVDAKTLPYLLKMADFSEVKDKEGKISSDSIKASLSKVIEDIPALKPEKQTNTGFQIGAGAQSGNQQQSSGATVPQKRWNRFNI